MQWNIILPLEKEILTFVAMGMNLGNIMLSEISQSYKENYCMISV